MMAAIKHWLGLNGTHDKVSEEVAVEHESLRLAVAKHVETVEEDRNKSEQDIGRAKTLLSATGGALSAVKHGEN